MTKAEIPTDKAHREEVRQALALCDYDFKGMMQTFKEENPDQTEAQVEATLSAVCAHVRHEAKSLELMR